MGDDVRRALRWQPARCCRLAASGYGSGLGCALPTATDSVIITIAAAGIVGLILQQLSVLLINWSAQQTGDQRCLDPLHLGERHLPTPVRRALRRRCCS